MSENLTNCQVLSIQEKFFKFSSSAFKQYVYLLALLERHIRKTQSLKNGAAPQH